MNLTQLATRLRNHSKVMKRNAAGAVRQTALAIVGELIEATPIDTGKAKSNWRVGVVSKPRGTIEAYFPGELGDTTVENIMAANDAAYEVLDSYNGGVVYIANNVDYLDELNAGKSLQQPRSGWIEGIMVRAYKGVKAAVRAGLFRRTGTSLALSKGENVKRGGRKKPGPKPKKRRR